MGAPARINGASSEVGAGQTQPNCTLAKRERGDPLDEALNSAIAAATTPGIPTH
jgi:hypothetical protein